MLASFNAFLELFSPSDPDNVRPVYLIIHKVLTASVQRYRYHTQLAGHKASINVLKFNPVAQLLASGGQYFDQVVYQSAYDG